MAFSQPNSQREIANRKILEDLYLKKQILLKQGVASSLNTSTITNIPNNSSNSDGHANALSSMQRAALQQANAQSMGYFISQDSSFVWPCMKLRHLQELLQQIDDFQQPKILLEQYVTPSHLASHMLYTIQTQYGDIDGKLVADLGCGCGALTVGAAALNAGVVVGFEIDNDALDTCYKNVTDQEFTNIDIIQCDASKDYFADCWSKKFDTVIMNPPFGTKHNAGIDMSFLKNAFQLSNNSVYSLHKTSTRSHVLKFASANGAKGEVLAKLRYDLPSTYKFHKKGSVDIEVDFFRFEVIK